MSAPRAGAPAMGLWRLEWVRLVRTRRWITLVATYVGFGLLGPVSARYMAQILGLAGGEMDGVTITLPDPVPSDGMVQYISNAVQVGAIVVIVVAAGALAFDAIPEMGVFLRTRVPDVRRILAPRVVVPFAAAAGAFILGTLAAWYETAVLLGPLDVTDVLLGTGLGVLFLAFVVALVAAVAQWSRSVLGTVMRALIVLLVLPIVGIVDVIGRWLPTKLGVALADLPTGTPASEYWGPAAVAVASIAGLLWLAVLGARRREA